ncbi:9964_t:CDS:2 [Funneliformis geosporum]|nr:9964_t:CDS:2 [Funneliformis geosporum]
MEDHRKNENEAIKNGDYLTAWSEYTLGIAKNPKDTVLWCNRALYCLKAGHPELAQRAQNLLKNCQEASQQILLCKAKYRYAEGLAAIRDYEEAINTQKFFTFRGSYPWDSRPSKRTSPDTLKKLQEHLEFLTTSQQTLEKLSKIMKFQFRSQNKDNTILRVVEVKFDDSSVNLNTPIFQEEHFLRAHDYQKQRCNYCLVELEGKEQHPCENPQCIDI